MLMFWKLTGWPMRLYAIIGSAIILISPSSMFPLEVLFIAGFGALFRTGRLMSPSARYLERRELWSVRYFLLFVAMIVLRDVANILTTDLWRP